MELSLEAKKIQIECLNNKFVIGLSFVVSNVYFCLIERGPFFCFHCTFGQLLLAKKECHLSICDLTNIDQAKNQKSFTSFVYKNANKILLSRMSN
jgi:hypothetical protein